MKHLKRIVAYVTVLSLCMVSILGTLTVCAEELPASSNNKILMEKYNMYADAADDIELIKEKNNYMEYKITYNFEEGKVVSVIKTYINDGGNQVLDITEGEKHDVLTINSDGSLYIDGKKVIIEDDETESLSLINPPISTMGAHRVYWTNTPPYGSASDYSKLDHSGRKSLVCEKFIKDLTISATIELIGAGLVSLGIAGAWTAELFKECAKAIINWYKEQSPKGKALSLTFNRYVHKTKGFFVSTSKGVDKYKFYYFGTKNYEKLIGTDVKYQVFSY